MKRKKVLSLLLAFMMMFSIFTGNVKAETNAKDDLTAKRKAAVLEELKKNAKSIKDIDKTNAAAQILGHAINDDENDGTKQNEIKPDDYVRIIVELEGDSAIEKAQKQKISINSVVDQAKKIQEAQKPFISSVKQYGIIKHTYQKVLNGFSANVKFKDIDNIRKINGVKKVSVAKVYYPDMKNAVELTQVKAAWESAGLKGEGIVVAIVDTGIDYTHSDMKLTDASKAKLNLENVLLEGDKGKFFTDKVPYGYNFADLNLDVIDKSGSMHGMHVSGIVAGNGKVEGVAPEAQLLAMKVFSNDPLNKGAFTDDISAAIESSVAHGADVINMSLGSPCGFVNVEDPEQRAIKNAADAGVICVVSAGNSAYTSDGRTDAYPLNYDIDPDMAMVGAPGLYDDTLQIASFENTIITLPAFEYKAGEEAGLIGYSISSEEIDPLKIFREELEIVDCGKGYIEEVSNKDLNGKIALIQRGGEGINFILKKQNAQAYGAAGVIIYNKDGDDSYVTMANDPSIIIPTMFINNTDGKLLKSLISNNVKLTFKGKVKEAPNSASGSMSDYSSWGTTPDLKFKPEVTAPGGQIYSTLNNNKYGSMSGTSMAAPHASGAAALVVEHLKKSMPELNSKALVDMAKTLLINTAKPMIEDEEYNLPYLTRKQGAGLIQINDAVKTKVYAVDENNNAAISLKEVLGNKEFTIKLRNFGNEDLTFTVKDKYGVLTSYTEAGYVFPNTKLFEGAKLSFDKNEVIVPKDGEALVKVKLSMPENPINQFVEGFITFESKDKEKNPDIGTAYMGFNGRWDEPRIFDSPIWSDDTFYEIAGLLSPMDYDLYFLEDNENYRVFSPNYDEVFDAVYPIASLLRNAREVKVQVLNNKKEVIRSIAIDEYMSKNYGPGNTYILKENWGWDGTLYNPKSGNYDIAPEGDYYIRLVGKINFEGAREQNLDMKVNIDLTPPTVNARYEKMENGQYKIFLDGKDNIGVKAYAIFVNDRKEPVLVVPGSEKEVVVDLLNDINGITVIAADYGYNISEPYIAEVDNQFIEINKKDIPEYTNQTAMSIEYKVKDVFTDSAHVEITVDENEPVKVENSGTLELKDLKDGNHIVKFVVISLDEKIIGEDAVSFTVDTVKPVIKLVDPKENKLELKNGETSYKLIFAVEDENIDIVTVDGKEVEIYPEDGMYKYYVEIENGAREVEIAAKDKVGYEAEKVKVSFTSTFEKPIIQVLSPSPDEIINGLNVKVQGIVNYNTPVDKVFVNGEEFNVNEDGSFAAEITLDGYGKKNIKVETRIGEDIIGTNAFDVFVSPLLFDEKSISTKETSFTLNYTIEELCTELDHVDIIVNTEKPINNLMNTSFEFSDLMDGPNYIKFECVDKDGNVFATDRITITVDRDAPYTPEVMGIKDIENLEDGEILESGSRVSMHCISILGRLSKPVESMTIKVNEKLTIIPAIFYDIFIIGNINLNEGENQIIFTLEDLNGNTNEYLYKLYNDTEAPVITMTDPTEDGIVVDNDVNEYELKFNVTDTFGSTVYVNGEVLDVEEIPEKDLSYTANIADGINIIEIKAVDLMGNTSFMPVTIYKNIDKPMIDILSTNISGKTANIFGKVFNINGLKCGEEEVELNEYGYFRYTKEFDSYGPQTITFTGSALDEEGNEITIEKIATIDVIKNIKPVITVTEPENGAKLYDKTVKVSGNVAHDDKVTLTVNGTEVEVGEKGDFTTDVTFVDYGFQKIVVEAKDSFGCSSIEVVGIVINEPIPEIELTVTSPTEGQKIQGKKVNVAGTVSSNVVKLFVNEKECEFKDNKFNTTLEFDSYGKKVITVKANDKNENEKQVVVNVELTEPYSPPYYPPVVLPTLNKITVTASKDEILKGGTAVFKAVAQYSDNKETDITDKATWSADHGTIEKGNYKADADYVGKAIIKAAYEGKTAEASITIKEEEKKDEGNPKVGFVGLMNSEAKFGEKQIITFTSKGYTGKVQYKVFYLQRDEDVKVDASKWQVLTDWTDAVAGDMPFEIELPAGLAAKPARYDFAVRVKKAGTDGTNPNALGGYDDAYLFRYVFKSQSNANADAVKADKTEVKVGEKITITGKEGVTYRLFTFKEGRKERWDKTAVTTGNPLVWTAGEAGYYVLDVQVMEGDKVVAWKLITVKVVEP